MPRPTRPFSAPRANLYALLRLRRVYYSAFSPIPDPRRGCRVRAPLSREHRLYQADWLLRFYGFSVAEVGGRRRRHARSRRSIRNSPGRWRTATAFRSTSTPRRASACCGCPASAPGRSTASSPRGAAAGCGSTTSPGCRPALSRARPFIVTADYRPGRLLDDAKLRHKFAPQPAQLSLFDEARCTQP